MLLVVTIAASKAEQIVFVSGQSAKADIRVILTIFQHPVLADHRYREDHLESLNNPATRCGSVTCRLGPT